jgi:hypothetical protein
MLFLGVRFFWFGLIKLGSGMVGLGYHTTRVICPSVSMIQLQKDWTDLDEIWYVGCAIGN